MFGLSLDLHVHLLSYFVDYSRTGTSESLLEANAISDKLA